MKGLIAKEGISFLLVPLVGALVCVLLGWGSWGVVLALLGCGLGAFFGTRIAPFHKSLV